MMQTRSASRSPATAKCLGYGSIGTDGAGLKKVYGEEWNVCEFLYLLFLNSQVITKFPIPESETQTSSQVAMAKNLAT